MGKWKRYHTSYNWEIGVDGALYKSMEFVGEELDTYQWMIDLLYVIWL